MDPVQLWLSRLRAFDRLCMVLGVLGLFIPPWTAQTFSLKAGFVFFLFAVDTGFRMFASYKTKGIFTVPIIIGPSEFVPASNKFGFWLHSIINILFLLGSLVIAYIFVFVLGKNPFL